jgi:predicted lipid-binding transport protein (Tim44 family)
MHLVVRHGEIGMGRTLAGVSGVLLGAVILAPAATAATATHGGWLPALGALALGGVLGSLFGGSGFGAAFILTLLTVIAVVAIRVFGKARQEPPAAPQAPVGVDSAQILRSAKLNFVKLQAARDLGMLDQVREFTTKEMFDRLRADRGGRKSEVLELNAQLLEAGSEADRQQVSVRLSGMVRAAPGTAPVGFVEVWNLAKPVSGASGWQLAGIRQMH